MFPSSLGGETAHHTQHSNDSDLHLKQTSIDIPGYGSSNGIMVTDSSDEPPPYTSSSNINDTNGHAPPTLVRRMSSSFIDRMDTSQLGSFFPSSITSHIPGMGGGGDSKNVVKATYFCNICLNYLPLDDAFTLSSCGHRFCSQCLRGFCKSQIENGIIYLKCFHPMADDGDRPCSQNIDECDIQQLVDTETWSKYNKFKLNQENALSRQCPYCEHTSIGTAGSTRIDCENPLCGKSYCLKHSNAHPMSESCESYELRMRKEDRINEMAAQEMDDGCKPCPKCQFRIIKSGGCNHMKCVKCGCSFCWLCMEEVEDEPTPNHYKDPLSGCKGKQFEGTDMESERPPLCVLIIVGCLMVIFAIPCTALALVGCIFTYPCACCAMCVVEGEAPNMIRFFGGCAFGCTMIPVVVICIFLVMLWMYVSSLYNILKDSICPCLPQCHPSCQVFEGGE